MKQGELLDLIKTRRSIRKFTSQPVPDDILQDVLEAGIWAPSACNQTLVRFVVVKDKGDLAILNAVKPNIVNPQAAILVVLDMETEFYQRWYSHPHTKQNPLLDVGAAVQDMALTIHSHGLASCWTSFSPYIDYKGYREFFRRFRLPPTCRISSVLFLGYPAQTIDIKSYTHHKRVIDRGPLENYLMQLPPRVLLVGAHPPDFDNLGSQAMTSGMKRLIERGYPGAGYAELAYPWINPYKYFPSYGTLDILGEGEQLKLFLLEVEYLVQVGKMLRDEREEQGRGGPVKGLKKWLKLVPGVMGKSPFKPVYPSYNARLNDPLTVGSGPVLPELPEGSAKGKDGWLTAVSSNFPRMLNRVIPSFLVNRLPKWAMILFRYQFRYVQPAYLSRLSFFSWADVVYFDGDGLFSDTFEWSRNLVLRFLAECLAAKRLGARVYVVNQTVSLSRSWIKEITAHVYNEMDGIVVREPETRQRLLAMGVRAEQVIEAADAALWAQYGGKGIEDDQSLTALREKYRGSIVLFIRGDLGEDVKLWAEVVNEMDRRYKRPIVFLPSCRGDDISFAEAIAGQSPLQVVTELKSYRQNAFFLEEMSLVISSRYHPIYFSIVAGVPFAAVRGNTFKTEGLLRMLEYPLPVIKEGEGYKQQVLEQVDYIFKNQSDLKDHIQKKKEILKSKAEKNVVL